MRDYIFIDTFALSQLTNDCYDDLLGFLKRNNYQIIITSMELVELYNPNPTGEDRIYKISRLLTEIPFVISDQKRVMDFEEFNYPDSLLELPIEFSSEKAFVSLKKEEKWELLYRLFSVGLSEYQVNLKQWVEKYNSEKALWINEVHKIMKNASESGIIDSKDNFVQSLDLRLCDNFVKIKVLMDNGGDMQQMDKVYLNKLAKILDCQDTWRMKGIHFSSLIFWYDYIIAKKNILSSDIADIYYSPVFPYCDVVIVDNSRYDCYLKIQREENIFSGIKIYNKKVFLDKMNGK